MIKPKVRWFLAFTAFFAVLAGFVFWGTWSLDMVPVMPDCATSFPVDYVTHWLRDWQESGKFVPGDLLVFVGSPYFWVELQYVLAIYCAALALVYFLRGRGLSPLASYGSGLLLAFSGYWLTLFSAGHLGWFQWMTYGVFVFGLIDRALLKGRLRHWLFLGACLAWGSFYQADLWLLFTIFSAGYFLFRWFALARQAKADAGISLAAACFQRRWLKGSFLALIVFLLIGFPSFRSAIFSDLAARDQQVSEGQTVGTAVDEAEKRWLFATNWSMPPEDTAEFLIPRLHGDTSCPLTLAVGTAHHNGVKPYTGRLGRPKDAPSGNYRQHSLHVGPVTCLFALIALVAVFRSYRRKDASAFFVFDRPTVLFFACAAVSCWLFSMGRFCELVYRLVYALPMGDYLRAPVKWHHLTEFSLVVLAGFGLEFTNNWMKAQLKLRPSRAAMLLGAVVALGAGMLASNAHRFCAPCHADTQLAPIMQVSVPTPDRARQAQMMKLAREQGLLPVGFVPLSLLTPDPKAKNLSVLWVEQRRAKPEVRPLENGLSGAPLAFAWISAFSTVLLLVFIGLGFVERRLGRLEVR